MKQFHQKSKKAYRILSEAGKIALKSKNDEALSEESLEKHNGDEVLSNHSL